MNRTKPVSDSTATKNDQTEARIESASLGFNPYAERLNGRLAMIGFSVLLASALVAHQGF
jgi:hypothetical protein